MTPERVKNIADNYSVESVVAMSVYQGDRCEWIEKAIESVFNQSYQKFLICIVIDGEVTEEVLNMLECMVNRYQRIVILQVEVCLGLANAMNLVTELCREWRPKYFFRMDSDDICLPNRFETQVDFLNSNCDVDVLGSSLIEIDEFENQVGQRIVSQHHEVLFRAMSRRCPLNHPTVCIRYDTLIEKGCYLPEHKNTQDYFLWITLANKGARFANIRDPLLKFRRVDGFYKRRGRSKSLNELKARFTAMRELNQWSLFNICYAIGVFVLRMMPSPVVKLAYKFDRAYLHKRVTDK